MTIIWIIGLVLFVFFGLIVFVGSPYVPSRRRDIERAFSELYTLSSKDTVVDLGSGDGVVLRIAVGKGARAFGVELNPLLVGISRILSWGNARLQVQFGDIHTVPFPPESTLVYMFPNTKDVARLTKRCETEAARLGRRLYVMSYGTEFPRLTPVKTQGAYHLYQTSPLQRI